MNLVHATSHHVMFLPPVSYDPSNVHPTLKLPSSLTGVTNLPSIMRALSGVKTLADVADVVKETRQK